MFMPWFVPWCVNERTTGFAFEIAKSATNDPVQSLTKSLILQRISGTFWKTGGALSVLSHQALKCVILTAPVKCAQNDPGMMHNSAAQWRMFDESQSRQNDTNLENFKFFKKSNTVPLQLLKSLCIPQQLMKSLSIPLLILEIMITTTGTVQHDAAAACCRLHNSRIQRLPLTGQKPTKIIIFE